VDVLSNAATGLRNITVTNNDYGVASCTACFTVNIAPTPSAATPSARGQGASGEVIAISGTNLVDTPAVTFSGSGITVTNTTFVPAGVNPAHVDVTVNVAGGATPGPRDITVANPDHGTGVCHSCFTVDAAPTITSLNPSSRGQGASNQIVEIHGTGFLSGIDGAIAGSGVTLNSTTLVNAGQLERVGRCSGVGGRTRRHGAQHRRLRRGDVHGVLHYQRETGDLERVAGRARSRRIEQDGDFHRREPWRLCAVACGHGERSHAQ